MTRRRFNMAVFVLAFALAVWWFILPPALGGRTTLFMTQGISMQPYIEQGDVAVLRKQNSYKVGDVIAFHARSINATSLHRIVDIDPTVGIITKGDNNPHIDLDHPEPEDIIGKNVFLVSGGAKFIEVLTSTAARVIGVGLIGWALWSGFKPERDTAPARPKRERRGSPTRQPTMPMGARPPSPTSSSPPPAEQNSTVANAIQKLRLPAVAGGALVLSLLLLFVSFSQPMSTKTERSVFYALKGKYGYSGQAAPGGEMVYRDGQVSTGDPIFTSLLNELLVTYAFELDTMGSFDGNGTATKEVILSGRSGWTHVLSRSQPVKFSGSEVRLNETLNVEEIRRVGAQIAALTNVPESSYTVSIRTNVQLDGELNGTEFKDTLPASLSLTLDNNTVKVEKGSSNVTAGPAEDPRKPATVLTGLTPLKGGEKKVEVGTPGQIQALGNTMAVATARAIAIVGTSVSLAFLIFTLLVGGRPRNEETEDISDEAAAQYRDLFVPITKWSRTADHVVNIDVSSLRDLARIADSHETFVLRQNDAEGESFIVNHGQSTYRYQRPAVAPAQRFGLRTEDASEVATEVAREP